MINRRHFVQATLTSTALLGSSWVAQVSAELNNPQTSKVFSHGVASGDPTHTSIVLWTRVTPDTEQNTEVEWQLAKDLQFQDIVQSGKSNTNAYRDFSVKLNVENLKPGTTYYYRFCVNGVCSETGRTKTLPEGKLDSLVLAVASCSNYPFGYFNAYEVIAADDDVDFVLHLGDYLYEYGHDSYGGETGKTINRNHQPSHEIVTLKDYRQRHAQYKSDRASRLMHAAHPLIVTWDDHESANNPYLTGAQNHQPNEGDWRARRNVSLQAYYEWMPVRDPAEGRGWEQLWRHFEFGDLATLTTLETRHTARALQINYADHIPNIKSFEEGRKFYHEVLGRPGREMISPEMKQFVANSLRNSVRNKVQWRIIGNQIPMARTHVPNVAGLLDGLGFEEGHPIAEEMSMFKRLGELDLPNYTDTWDGYPAAREDFYTMARKAGASDLLVLTGDSHSFWANQLFNAKGKSMGLELGTAGITSPGDFEEFGEDVAESMDHQLAEHNKEIVWTDGRHRGFVKLTLTEEEGRAQYVTVSDILTEKYTLDVINDVRFKKQGKRLVYK